jgi:hypothetical protein
LGLPYVVPRELGACALRVQHREGVLEALGEGCDGSFLKLLGHGGQVDSRRRKPSQCDGRCVGVVVDGAT